MTNPLLLDNYKILRAQCILILQINKSRFSTQYHIPLHPQVTISFPPLHKNMHHSSPPQGCRKLGTLPPISHPLVPASHTPLDTSVTHKPRRPPLSIGSEPETTPLKHQQEILTLRQCYNNSIQSAQIQALKNQG